MSNRHEASRSTAPGATHAAPTKLERRASNRKARHITHELLLHADAEIGEDLITPRAKHSTIDLDVPYNKKLQSGDAKPSREFRHWKQKFWKRRTSERARRAAMLADVD